jgi:hypothetical protein
MAHMSWLAASQAAATLPMGPMLVYNDRFMVYIHP